METKEEFEAWEAMKEKARNSEKQCSKCIHYIEQYVDDYTVRHFGYGKIKVRPACGHGNTYGFIDINHAHMCRNYKEKKDELQRLKQENEELKKRCEELDKMTGIFSVRLANKYEQALEEIREMLMCKIYNLNENASQLESMCYALDKFEKIRIKILTKINEVLNDRD